ncbi:hypothetical protein GobsT_39040 [Gemmata obscuriglobus]|nr:hypothetical protein GobsT_39040 [Gemmata obscuriglobus]VTS07805.1 Uncharacterized protein OS=Pirellula staleyi (strain ATCC 27377 / DSM 6068 / ICPB 4128) GN=Psta_4123 PE=4 SV=1 [Gemmata obscuriglobus UQM 2246]
MTSQERAAVMKKCQELSLAGRIAFPETVRRLSEAGVERYHVDLTRDETTYYLSCGESHALALGGPHGTINGPFDATGVEGAVRASQRGEVTYREFLSRIMAAGCVGYFTQITGRKVQYVGRTGDMHVEPFPGTTV